VTKLIFAFSTEKDVSFLPRNPITYYEQNTTWNHQFELLTNLLAENNLFLNCLTFWIAKTVLSFYYCKTFEMWSSWIKMIIFCFCSHSLFVIERVVGTRGHTFTNWTFICDSSTWTIFLSSFLFPFFLFVFLSALTLFPNIYLSLLFLIFIIIFTIFPL